MTVDYNLDLPELDVKVPQGDLPSSQVPMFMLASIAVSLKRIADAVCGTDTHTGIRDSLSFIDQALSRRPP